ncbi:polysaccharide biosynthesis C-terminal domain-containing protein [Dinghuibacter silviterrae]|uniref:O-antigen/teichoic acid export membrane protein n=1 Tax=Dinghuibacter silviterrae TaxID=1539049 RepID=A0A4R8DTE0_9BACT|nr:polysaccharide biosynthesis C-terminal domain-containing protein [Dinghuibacter silviterrae]TDX01178.1 O-antigen/teichoic acid export membrane protein [Dinghuibacter silviterrae]
MGQIRRQTILSSLSTYFGFLIGALNTYFFVYNGSVSFSADQYGLTRIFTDVGAMIYAFASMGTPSVLYKFYPYYKDNLSKEDNDLLTWALVLPLVGFVFVAIGGWVFEPLIVRKFSERSALFVVYYKWVFPFGLGFLLFSVLEAFAWTVKQSVFSTFLREGGVRLFILLLIIPYLLGWIPFDVFIKLFTLQYILAAIALWVFLSRRHLTNVRFKVSRVTRRFRKKIVSMLTLTYGGIIISIVAQAFDGVLIAGFMGLKYAGIYAFLLYIANVIQVPQRSVQAAAIPHLAQAWKDKDYGRIDRIYHRTSINLLLICTTLFCLIELCAPAAGSLFGIKTEYQAGLGMSALLLLGIARIVDAGTGVNGQIIGTSVYWRFDFFTGVILLALRIPLNVVLIKAYGINGSATADLISLVVYNAVRMIYLARKYKMQPFNWKSLLAVVYAIVAYAVAFFASRSLHGWTELVARGVIFVALYGGAVLLSNLTPDTKQVWDGVRKKFGAHVP